MKYSKELHDKLRNRTGLHIFNHQIGLDSEDIDALLDEIERLQAEVCKLAVFAAVHGFGGYSLTIPAPESEG